MERQGIQLCDSLLHRYVLADYLRASGTLPDASEMQDPADTQTHDHAIYTVGVGDSICIRLLEQVRLVHDTVRRSYSDTEYPLRSDLRDLHTMQTHRFEYAIR